MKRAFPDAYPDKLLHADWDLLAGIVRMRGKSKFPLILKQPTHENATLAVRAAELFDRSPQFDEGPSFFERLLQNRGRQPAG